LYQKIAEHLRKQILDGTLKPGAAVASIREMCAEWDCTPGTIQRAYQMLSQEGLLVSQAGRGTRVAGTVSPLASQSNETLRRAALVNKAEAFLLETITAGYIPAEIQGALDLALDRWRSSASKPGKPAGNQLRFAGSHDWVVTDLAHLYFGKQEMNASLALNYSGSLGGLMALADGSADIAGSHLWDAESGEYNLPFIRRVFPGKEMLVVTLAERRQGLIVRTGNPLKIQGFKDLIREDVKFINRQAGSGTRVWLDVMLNQEKISAGQINGYTDECLTHSDVARVVAEGRADAAVGLEIAAASYGLDFIYLNQERYDLVMHHETGSLPVVQKLIAWLASPEGKAFVAEHTGYESQLTGQTRVCTGL